MEQDREKGPSLYVCGAFIGCSIYCKAMLNTIQHPLHNIRIGTLYVPCDTWSLCAYVVTISHIYVQYSLLGVMESRVHCRVRVIST